MTRTFLIIALFLSVKTPSFSQTNIYLGGGMSSSNMDWCCEDYPSKNWMNSINVSFLSKTVISENWSISLGLIYNISNFETPVRSMSTKPVLDARYWRYAIPIKVQWNIYHSYYFSGGIVLNTFYREEYKKLYSENEVFEHTRPDLGYNFGIGGEWKQFLIDIGVARNLFEPKLRAIDYYWTIDFNVYYRILSSGKE